MTIEQKSINNTISAYGLCVLLFLVLPLPIMANSPQNSPIPPLFYQEEVEKRAFVVRLKFQSDTVTELQSVRVVQGPARILDGYPPQLRLEYVENGRVTKKFFAPSPLFRNVWNMKPPSEEFVDGAGMRHTIEKVEQASARLVLPFSTSAESLQVYDVKTGAVLSSINLKPAVRRFCTSEPSFDGCKNLQTDSQTAPLSFKEDCLSHDIKSLKVKQFNGQWKIVQDNRWLFDFGDQENEAKLSFDIIKRFNFNMACYVGRPQASMFYLKKDKTVPGGSTNGLDCITFDRDSIGVRREGTQWLLHSSTSRMVMFPNEKEARQAAEIIKHYNLNKHCFIGRPNPSFDYWLSS